MANRSSSATRNPIGQWPVPLKGVLRNIPIDEIPPDGLYSGNNLTVRAGSLQPRPGMTQFASTVLTGRPTGAINTATLASPAFQQDAFQNDAFQVLGSIPTAAVIVGTTQKIYTYFSGVFNDVTGSPDLTALDAELSRFTSIMIGTPPVIYVVHTNGRDPVRQWDSTSGTFTVVPGTPAPPNWTDVANIGDHIIGILPPYDVSWMNRLTLGAVPDLNHKSLAETSDPLVAIRNIGLLGGVAYKHRSIWGIIAQGGTEASFFRFDYRGSYEGPASPAAIVDVNGVHIYMADNGRIAAFDGYRHDWIVDGVWPVVQAELDQANINRIHGVYNPEFREVYFYYPRTGDAGECKGQVTIVLPRPKDMILDYIAFNGTISKAVSASVDLHLDVNKALVFTSATPKGYTVEGANDDGTNFSGDWQHSLIPMPKLAHYRVEALEVYAERGGGYGTLNYNVVSANLLETAAGSLGATGSISLAPATGTVGDPKGADVRGRFLGLKFSFTTPITLKWRGCVMSGEPREQ